MTRGNWRRRRRAGLRQVFRRFDPEHGEKRDFRLLDPILEIQNRVAGEVDPFGGLLRVGDADDPADVAGLEPVVNALMIRQVFRTRDNRARVRRTSD